MFEEQKAILRVVHVNPSNSAAKAFGTGGYWQ